MLYNRTVLGAVTNGNSGDGGRNPHDGGGRFDTGRELQPEVEPEAGSMNRKTVAVLTVVVLLLTAGCLEVTMAVDVSSDGEIESMDVEIEMDDTLYDQFEQAAQQDGYESVEAMLEADMMDGADEGQYEESSSSVERLDSGDYRISLTATNVDPGGLDGIEVTVEDGTVYYEDSDGIDGDDVGDGDDVEDIEEFEQQITMEYVVVMPGEIQDTNADAVSDDGTTATWDLVTTDAETLYAESEIGGDGSETGDTGSETSDDEGETDHESEPDGDEDETSDDGVPGFGVVTGLVALLIVSGFGHQTRSS